MELQHFFATLLVIGTVPYITGQGNVCDNALLSGVPDSQFNASSVYMANSPKQNYGPERGRLNLTETKDATGKTQIGAWSADKLDLNQYIQVELNDPSLIRGLITQGRDGCCKQWIKKYRVLYSMDCKNFTPVGDHNSSDAFFKGNSDENTPETNMFDCPVIAKCIRINPLEWNHHISLRFDLLGCSLLTGSGSSSQTTGTNAMPLVTSTGGAAQTTAAGSQTSITSQTGAQTNGQMSTSGSQLSTTGASQTSGATNAGAGLTSGAVNAATTVPAPGGKGAGTAKCLKDCRHQPNGDYQSCTGCGVYVTCSNGIMYDKRPCIPGLVWDDSKKRCSFMSKTCP